MLEIDDSTETGPYGGLSKVALYTSLSTSIALLNCSAVEHVSGAPQLRANTQVFFSFLGSFPNDAFNHSFSMYLQIRRRYSRERTVESSSSDEQNSSQHRCHQPRTAKFKQHSRRSVGHLESIQPRTDRFYFLI